jgi:site-specific DNA recombinase
MPLAESFDDEGETGATSQRPGLERLVAAILEGRVERVVVHRLDRLTRSILGWARLYRLFKANGVALTVARGGLRDADDATSQLHLHILALFAELERDMIAERLRDGRAVRHARGMRVAGRVPLGYLADPATKQLIVMPAEAETVRCMFASADMGEAPARIAANANETGVVGKSGRPTRWSAKFVLRILRNPVYAGLLPDGSPGAHDAVVSRDLFDRVGAAILGRRTRTPTKRPTVEGEVDPFLLRGPWARPLAFTVLPADGLRRPPRPR